MRYNHFDMLPEKAFRPVGKRMTLEGGSGGGSQTSTSTSTNLPTYAQPYYQELLKQSGKNVFTTDKDGYVTGVKGAGELPQQKRVGMQELTKQGIAGIAGLETPGQFAKATEGLTAGQGMGFNAAQQGLGRAFDYNPQNVAAMEVGTQNFGQDAANFYMNPYQQNVTNMALREAQQQGDVQRQAGAMGAISRGTFGGARQALMQAEGDRNLMRTMGDIQAQGSQQAFQNAQQQFQADQARQLQAQQANQAAGLQADQLNQQGQQFSAGLGKDIGLAGLSTGVDSSRLLGALGIEQQNAELSRLQAKVAAGEKEQAQLQGETDTDYQNRMSALNYEKQQLQFYSDILRGNANALGSTTVQYAPAPSIASQAAGFGLAGLSLAKAT